MTPPDVVGRVRERAACPPGAPVTDPVPPGAVRAEHGRQPVERDAVLGAPVPSPETAGARTVLALTRPGSAIAVWDAVVPRGHLGLSLHGDRGSAWEHVSCDEARALAATLLVHADSIDHAERVLSTAEGAPTDEPPAPAPFDDDDGGPDRVPATGASYHDPADIRQEEGPCVTES